MTGITSSEVSELMQEDLQYLEENYGKAFERYSFGAMNYREAYPSYKTIEGTCVEIKELDHEQK